MNRKTLSLAALVVYAGLSAQITYVGGEATFNVTDQALVYNGGGVKVDEAGKIANTGDMMLVGDTKDKLEVVGTGEFRLLHPEKANDKNDIYGQLYVNGISQSSITGKVTKEHRADVIHGDKNSGEGFQQMALPFHNMTIAELKTVFPYLNLTNTKSGSYHGRYHNGSAFYWRNERADFKQIANTDDNASIGVPTNYYIIPRRDGIGNVAGTVQWNPKDVIKEYKGSPKSDAVDEEVSVLLNNSFTGNYGKDGAARNYFGEKYHTYVNDPFVTEKWNDARGYARNIYQMGNPFLTNIDLSNIGTASDTGEKSDGVHIEKLHGIFQYGENAVSTSSKIKNGAITSYPGSSNILVTRDNTGKFTAGDVDKLVVKPMGVFILKLQEKVPSAELIDGGSFNMKGLRRFSNTVKTETSNASVAGKGYSQTVKQVGISLYDAQGNELGRTYYVVSNKAKNGHNPSISSFEAVVEDTPIFTRYEQPSGGLDTSIPDDGSNHLYINEANEFTFAGKEIPGFILAENAASLSFSVYEDGVRVGDKGLSTNVNFYIKNQSGVITKIVDGGKVPISKGSIGLYYGEPSNNILGNTEAAIGETIVYRLGEMHAIRFNRNWKSADVYVYSTSGQLVTTGMSIPTHKDYVLNLPQGASGVYIIKIVSSTGQVVTKKVTIK